MKTCLLLIISLAYSVSALADQEASNTIFIRASQYGDCYAKCIPAERYGMAGETRVYLTRKDADILLFTFDWYSSSIYLQGTAWGISTVRFGPWARGREASQQDLGVAFYLNGKLLKSYSTLDVAREKQNVEASVSHYTVFREIKGYRWIKENDFVFDVVTHDGRLLSFDVRTGQLSAQATEPHLEAR